MKLITKPLSRAIVLVVVSFSIVACGGKEERKALHMEKAKSLYAQSNYDKARVEFKNVLQIDPKSAEANYFVGRIEEAQKNWQNAFNSYRRAVELDPGLLDAKVSLGKLYVLSGTVAETEKIADDVLARLPGHSGGLFLKAAIMTRRGDTAGAIEEAKRSIAADAANTDAVTLIAGLYVHGGHGSLGMQAAPATARWLADRMTGRGQADERPWLPRCCSLWRSRRTSRRTRAPTILPARSRYSGGSSGSTNCSPSCVLSMLPRRARRAERCSTAPSPLHRSARSSRWRRERP